ncbi:hypothetical protein DV736_g3904, partial [Chaetothyriales sp. CBS 134916]
MRSTVFSIALALAICVTAAPAGETVPASYMTGFKNPKVETSVGGQALCISGTLDITASANNTRINAPEPANQTMVTELVAEAVQIDTKLYTRILGDPVVISGTYSIYAQLCFPHSGINVNTVQFLIHGGGFDHSYWDFAPGYSYVDAAAAQGYTTFAYDRLGSGLSDHPDPAQVVQYPLQVAIAHELIQKLRTGGVAAQTFQHVVGVGHSLGSFQTYGVTAQHPNDLDAAVLTGFSTSSSGTPVAFAGLGLSIAAQNQPHRFAGLPNGYFTANAIESNQFFFFRAPGFDPALLELSEANKQLISMGEFLGVSATLEPTQFTGPIDVVNGANDLPNCHGNCLLPYNLAASVKDMYYPMASNSSSWYLAPVAGHGLNLHYSASEAYEHILDFIRKNGL